MAEITTARAKSVANRVITKSYGFSIPEFSYSYGPELVWATFEDGQERMAWYYVLLIDHFEVLMSRGVVVYVDANTAEPLMLLTNVVVGDPQMVCSMDILWSFGERQLEMSFLVYSKGKECPDLWSGMNLQ